MNKKQRYRNLQRTTEARGCWYCGEKDVQWIRNPNTGGWSMLEYDGDKHVCDEMGFFNLICAAIQSRRAQGVEYDIYKLDRIAECIFAGVTSSFFNSRIESAAHMDENEAGEVIALFGLEDDPLCNNFTKNFWRIK